jgi:flagellar biosynthesis protein FlhA
VAIIKTDSPLMQMIGKNTDLAAVVAVICVVVMMVIPIPPGLMDFLLALNTGLALLLLLLTMNVQQPLELAVFPSLLLITTLFRLSLNISTTRLILSKGFAGHIVQAFGNFVIGGNYVVGFAIFLILVVIQFVVITKGAERVAEVAARFTLDAMPGKQMSIDADLNAGIIDEDTARQRRKDIEREADFYGAMDGASKFVKGDAIAGIVITIINIIGGFAIGIGQQGMSLQQALQHYTLLTVGDGLVTQIPALLISTSSGIIITRAASERNLGADIGVQLFSNYKVLMVTGAVLALFGLIPGLPTVPYFLLAAFLFGTGRMVLNSQKKKEMQLETERLASMEEESKKPENLSSLLQRDVVELEIGYSLIPLVDSAQGGDILERITMIRRQLAIELGIIVPIIRIRDNMQLLPSEYCIKLQGVEMCRVELLLGHYLAMDAGNVTSPVDGISTNEPAFGLPALWIKESLRDQAELSGYTVVDIPSIIATHLTEILRSNAAELLSRQDVKRLLDGLKEENQSLVDDLIPEHLTLGEMHRVLQNLLSEGIPVKNLVMILEALSDGSRMSRDIKDLVEIVREALKRQISQLYTDESGIIYAINIDPEVEKELVDSLEQSDRGLEIRLSSVKLQLLYESMAEKVEQAIRQSRQPVILCSPQLRRPLREIVARVLPRIPVMSYVEVAGNVKVHSVGMVSFKN